MTDYILVKIGSINFMVIDFHTHCFPEKLADRAISTLSYAAGVNPNFNGSPSGLMKSMDKSGVDVSVVLNIATNTKQQTAVNNFAAELNSERLICFGSVHPDAENVFDELERVKDMGLLGVKFHPEYQKFFVDEDRMKPIYNKISSLGLITVFHAGWDVGFDKPYHCMPEHLQKALGWFSSPVVAAHWGGFCCWDKVIDTLCGIENLYIDTSMGYSAVPKPMAEQIIEKHGIDKMLFGSDNPWLDPALEMVQVNALDLNEEEKNKIYYLNAQKLLGI